MRIRIRARNYSAEAARKPGFRQRRKVEKASRKPVLNVSDGIR